jgi:hypothetical protein
MRNLIKAPNKHITQGTIFSGVRSPFVVDYSCYGICITARCDTAREFKAPCLTFLPVVRLESWLWVEGLSKAISDQKKGVLGSLKKQLEQLNGTSIILDTFGPEEAFSSVNLKDKGIKKQYDLFTEALLAEKVTPFNWAEIPDSISKRIETEANLLLKGKVQDFYFLDDVEGIRGSTQNHQTSGFVVLLRDVRSISRELAFSIAVGIDEHQLDLLKINDQTAHQLVLDEDGYAYPTGELLSPFIEQLLQNFSILFGRIGTKDVPNIYSECVQKLLWSQV